MSGTLNREEEPALVGIVTTGYTRWFAEMLAELGHELAGDKAAAIRKKQARKQKYDDREAQHVQHSLVAS